MDSNKTIFSNEMKIGHTKDKNGTVTFYPMTFTKGKDYSNEEYRGLLTKSFEVDKMIDGFNAPVGDVVEDAKEVFEKKN